MKVIRQLIHLTKNPAVIAAGTYTFSNFFGKAVAFLLLFVYSNPAYITPQENGLLSLMNSGILFLSPFVCLGTIQSTSSDFFKLDKQEFSNFFTTGFVMPIIVTLFSMLLFGLFYSYFASSYGFPASFIWVVPLSAFLLFSTEQFAALIRNNHQPNTYLKAHLLRLAIEIGLSLILVIVFMWHWKGRVTGIIASQITITVWAYFYFKKKGYLFGQVKKEYIKGELLYALPIILMQSGVFCMMASDKFFLSHYTGDNARVGVYGYACIFASVVNIFCTALLQYVFPKVFAYLAAEKVNYLAIRKHFFIYALATFAGLVGIVAFSPLMYKWFINASYHPGLKYMYLIAAGYFIWGICYFFYSDMLFHKQKKKILTLSAISIVISLSCHFFFIPRWFEQGAAVSVFVSYVLVLIITLLFSYKYVRRIFSNHNAVA
jgi:O-antigen/teichoic acid export membrane protein